MKLVFDNLPRLVYEIVLAKLGDRYDSIKDGFALDKFELPENQVRHFSIDISLGRQKDRMSE